METLALISPIYSLSTYLLCALVLMWISVYFRRAKQFKENVWIYSAKVVPLWVGLVGIAFPFAFAMGNFIRGRDLIALGDAVLIVASAICLALLGACLWTFA